MLFTLSLSQQVKVVCGRHMQMSCNRLNFLTDYDGEADRKVEAS